MNAAMLDRISSFEKLGNEISHLLSTDKNLSKASSDLKEHISLAGAENPWFTRDNILAALEGIAHLLRGDNLKSWLHKYTWVNEKSSNPKTVAVIMAGNLPMVGFHDFMCVLLSGHRVLGKLSGQDKHLPVKLANLLIEIDPGFDPMIAFSDTMIKDFDAVIATGSNNSARYFEYYFGKYPHIIRKNRSSLAVLSGEENPQTLELLADDVCKYFGMGCRSVSKILIPHHYDLTNLIYHFEKWNTLKNHSRYFNNYEYHKAVFLVNGEKHLDNGFLLLKEDQRLSSPLAVLYYQFYDNISDVTSYIESNIENLQCVASDLPMNLSAQVPVGQTQNPNPWDYADGVDTIEFLQSIG
jgi:hypothetical protein